MHLREGKILYFDSNFTKENKSTLVQVIVWCSTGDKPILETMMTHVILTYATEPQSIDHVAISYSLHGTFCNLFRQVITHSKIKYL